MDGIPSTWDGGLIQTNTKCSVKRGINASAKGINSGQSMQSAEADLLTLSKTINSTLPN